jgi:YbbR domain-containing protein
VRIDFRSYQATGSFEAGAHLEVINLSLEKGLQAIACTPNEVPLDHYEKANKIVPVALQLDYKLMESLRLSSPLRFQPDSVLVVGPSELLDTLRFWSMPGIKIDGTIRADTHLYLPLVARAPFEVVQKELMVSFDVDAYTEEVHEVQIAWKNLPEGLMAQLSSNRVQVHCLVPLNRYEELHTTPINVVVDYLDLRPESRLLFPKVENLPEGIEGLRITPAWVECVITQP